MSHEPELPNQLPGESTPGEATICFDNGAQLPEATMAFDSQGQELPDSVHYPSVMNYTAKEEVGRGGMAKIFLADDLQLKRLVAIKVSTADTSIPDTLFQTEAEVLSNLAHPNIPPIHSCGFDDSGRAFYSMKLIRGQTLQSIIKQLAAGDPDVTASFTLARLLEIFRKVCDGVAFAHAKGFLHRDLKPENIMVGEFGEVLVMDWGLALAFETDTRAQHQHVSQQPRNDTGTIRLQGTPQYMSPEQAEGMLDGLDERSDVYALGGVLHAILTTQSPVSGRSIQEVLDRVRDGQIAPIPNSRVVHGASGKIEVPIPEALRAVARKAMAKIRTDRYTDVTALVADIEAYQSGFATSAEQAGFLRQLTLLVKRNRAASLLVAVLVMVAAAFTVRLAQSEKLSRLRALEAQQSAASARRSAADAQMTIAEFFERENHFGDLQRTLQAVPEEFRDQSWRYLEDRLNADGVTIQIDSSDPYPFLAVQPVAKKAGVLTVLEKGGHIRSVNLNTGAVVDLLKIDPAGLARMLAVSADGNTLATIREMPRAKNAPGNAPKVDMIEIYDVPQKRLKYRTPTLHGTDLIIFNDACDLFGVYSYAGGGTFLMHDAASGARLWEKAALEYFVAWFSSDGAKVNLLTSKHSRLQLDARTGQNSAPPTTANYPVYLANDPRTISVSPAGTEAFLVSKEGFDLADTKTGKLRHTVQLPLGNASLRTLDADWTNQFLFCGFRRTEHEALIQVLSARDGRKLMSVGLNIPDLMRDLKILSHPLSKHLVAVSGKYIRAWRLQPAAGFKRFELGPPPPHAISQTFCFLDGSKRAVAYLAKNNGRFLSLLNLNPGSKEETPFEAAGEVNGNFGATVTSDSTGLNVIIASVARNNKHVLQVYKSEGNSLKPVIRKDVPSVIRNRFLMTPLHISPSGKEFIHGRAFLNTETFKQAPEFMNTSIGYQVIEEPVKIAWVKDEHIVEIAVPAKSGLVEPEDSPDRALLLWSREGAKLIQAASAPNAVAVAASPDASQIAEAGKDLRVRIRDAQTLQTIREIRMHDAPLTAVAWHPRLPFLATASEDHRVKIVDLRTYQVVKKIGLFEGLPNNLYWSPDGKTLAVQSAQSIQSVEPSFFIDLFNIDCCSE
jgi:serine/threonine protein kinase/WD40 repeat protein